MTEPLPDRDFVESLSLLLDTSTARIEGALVVKVQSFDRATQTAEVVPQVLRGGEQLPNVLEVPVIFPTAYHDVQVGEFGLLIVGGLNWRRWWRTGEISPVEDNAIHSLTNGILLPGLRPQASPRDLVQGTTVVQKPTVTGSVRLGVYNADKKAVHEDLLTDLNSFLGVLTTWGATDHGTWTVAAANFTANVAPKIAALITGIGLGSYRSPSVQVES